jgi:hypothetical protein
MSYYIKNTDTSHIHEVNGYNWPNGEFLSLAEHGLGKPYLENIEHQGMEYDPEKLRSEFYHELHMHSNTPHIPGGSVEGYLQKLVDDLEI